MSEISPEAKANIRTPVGKEGCSQEEEVVEEEVEVVVAAEVVRARPLTPIRSARKPDRTEPGREGPFHNSGKSSLLVP